MDHAIRLEGHGFSLRPITLDDAPLIVELRGEAGGRSLYLHPIDPDIEAQRHYLQRYLEWDNDYYFIVERRTCGHPEGLIALYDIDADIGSAEWGRWILKPGSLAALESAWLIYRVAFEVLGLNEVYSSTVAENQPVVSFHDSFGLSRCGVIPGKYILNGQTHDAVQHVLTREKWALIAPAVSAKAKWIADRMES